MKVGVLFADEEAVTPVVGIILLVALAVILGSIVAGFGIGLADRTQKAPPSASFSFQYTGSASPPATACTVHDDGSSGVVNVTHRAGDTIDLRVSEFTIEDQQGTEHGWTACGGQTTANSQVQAGHSAHVVVDADDRLRLVWERADKTAVIARWQGPAA